MKWKNDAILNKLMKLRSYFLHLYPLRNKAESYIQQSFIEMGRKDATCVLE